MKKKGCFEYPHDEWSKTDEKADDNHIDDVGINEIHQGKKWPRP